MSICPSHTFIFTIKVTFSSWAVMSSRLKLEASGGLPWCPVGALIVPAGDARALLLLLLAPLLPPPPLTLLLLLPPPLPQLLPAGCCLLLRPAGGFWRTWTRGVSIDPVRRGWSQGWSSLIYSNFTEFLAELVQKSELVSVFNIWKMSSWTATAYSLNPMKNRLNSSESESESDYCKHCAATVNVNTCCKESLQLSWMFGTYFNTIQWKSI